MIESGKLKEEKKPKVVPLQVFMESEELTKFKCEYEGHDYKGGKISEKNFQVDMPLLRARRNV